MGKRREGREAAVQCLFADDLQGKVTEEGHASFWDLHSARPGARSLAVEWIRGVHENRDAIDAEITSVLTNFSLERLAVVDRNILRLAVYELMFSPDLPAPVILNEAIEIAKSLGATESGGFVNGVLQKLSEKLRGNVPPRAAAEIEAE